MYKYFPMFICTYAFNFISFCRTLISELVRMYSPLVKLGVLWPTTLSLEHSALQPCKHHLRISSFPVATGKVVSRSCPLMMEGWCKVSDIIKMSSAVLQVRVLLCGDHYNFIFNWLYKIVLHPRRTPNNLLIGYY